VLAHRVISPQDGSVDATRHCGRRAGEIDATAFGIPVNHDNARAAWAGCPAATGERQTPESTGGWQILMLDFIPGNDKVPRRIDRQELEWLETNPWQRTPGCPPLIAFASFTEWI